MTYGPEEWMLEIEYQCSEWKEMCSDFTKATNFVNFLYTGEIGARHMQCDCEVSGKFAIDFVDVRLNYNQDSCSSSTLHIEESQKCIPNDCFNATYSCTSNPHDYSGYFLQNIYESTDEARVTFSLRTSACPAKMVWLKLRAVGTMNVAFGKTVTMSSVYTNPKFAPSPGSNAVNGIKSGVWSDDSCASTNEDRNPWLLLDLEEQYVVYGLQIVNRKDSSPQRLRNLIIEFGATFDELRQIYFYSGQLPHIANINLNRTYVGQYLRFSMSTTEYLTICEIEVYAFPRIRCRQRSVPVSEQTSDVVCRAESKLPAQNGKLPVTTLALAIALGVMTLIVATIALTFFCYRRRKKEKGKLKQPAANPNAEKSTYRLSNNAYSENIQINKQLQHDPEDKLSQKNRYPEMIIDASGNETDYGSIEDSELCFNNTTNDKEEPYHDMREQGSNEPGKMHNVGRTVSGGRNFGQPVTEISSEENAYDHLNAISAFDNRKQKEKWQKSAIKTVGIINMNDKTLKARNSSNSLTTDINVKADQTEKVNSQRYEVSEESSSSSQTQIPNRAHGERQNIRGDNDGVDSAISLGSGESYVSVQSPTGVEHPYFVLDKQNANTAELKKQTSVSKGGEQVQRDKAKGKHQETCENNDISYFMDIQLDENKERRHVYSLLQADDSKNKIHDYLVLEAGTGVQNHTK